MLISVEEASRRIAAAVSPGGTERVPLRRAAGRILREALGTARPLPPFDRVMMDGVAVPAVEFGAGRRRFRVAGRVHAGEPTVALPEREACVWVMTGAVCPPGADLVIPREVVREHGEWVEIDASFAPPPGGFVHARGSDAAAGSILLEAGVRLDGPALGVAASCGAAQVQVARRPRIALVSTGDELVEPGEPLALHQIPRSNGYALTGLLGRHLSAEFEHCHLRDEPSALRAGLEPLLESQDLIVCSGGVSKGDRDFLPAVWQELGVEELFHGVAQRPGKPFWAGRARNGILVLALPGNPVSTLVGGRRYVLPALQRWLGQRPEEPETLALAAAYAFSPALTCFLPVHRRNERAEPLPTRNSGDFVSLLGSDGFVELPAETDEFAAGFAARYFPW